MRFNFDFNGKKGSFNPEAITRGDATTRYGQLAIEEALAAGAIFRPAFIDVSHLQNGVVGTGREKNQSHSIGRGIADAGWGHQED